MIDIFIVCDVWVVDDDCGVCFVLVEVLCDVGYVVCEFGDVVSVCDVLKIVCFVLLFIDVCMFGEDGLVLLGELKV